MAQQDGAIGQAAVASPGPSIVPAALGMHIGLAVVCGSAVYTGWQRAIVTLPQWGVMLLVAAALLAAALWRRSGMEKQVWVRGCLALAGLLLLFLCYDPQLGAIGPLADLLPAPLVFAYPSIALPAILLTFICWIAYRRGGGEPAEVVPFRAAAWWAMGLIAALALFAYAVLHGPHSLALESTLRPILAATQGGLLVIVLTGIGGGPAVRRAPHVYMALALVLAFARNIAYPVG